MLPLGLGGQPLPFGELETVGLQHFPSLGQLGEQLLLVFGDLFGLGLQRLRIRPG